MSGGWLGDPVSKPDDGWAEPTWRDVAEARAVFSKVFAAPYGPPRSVYVLLNDTPPDWHDSPADGIIDVFYDEEAAKHAMEKLKRKDAFTWQYLEVKRYRVRTASGGRGVKK